jgi:hypothetical protein
MAICGAAKVIRKIAGAVLIFIAIALQSGWSIPSFDRLPVPPFGQSVKLENAWFVVVEESDGRPAFVANLKSDFPLWAEVEAMGAKRRFIDKDLPEAEPYRERAEAIGLPSYILVNGDEKVVSSGKLPESREAVLAIVRQG